MAGQVDPLTPLTLVAIDIARDVNVALVYIPTADSSDSGVRTSVRRRR